MKSSGDNQNSMEIKAFGPVGYPSPELAHRFPCCFDCPILPTLHNISSSTYKKSQKTSQAIDNQSKSNKNIKKQICFRTDYRSLGGGHGGIHVTLTSQNQSRSVDSDCRR